MDAPFVLSNTLEKSANDDREYKYIRLDNGLRAVVVSDPTADKGAAALDVNVGSFSDRDEIPGIAHYLEHMLFLGTEKYPSDNEYSSFLNDHGGSSNAWTSAEHTQYFFDVERSHLEGALDRFAQFFIAPLFTKSAADRELNAVDSENSKNLQNDMWRLYQLDKSTSDPAHPYSKFATGNLATLKTTPDERGVDVRAALLAFHQEFYSASVMTLAVLGRESLDELEAWVRTMFSGVRNTGRSPPKIPGSPYGKDQVGVLQLAVPVKDKRTVEVAWALPPQSPHYLSKPTSLLGHLIGHEGPGSLLSLLKARNFATGLSAGSYQDFSGFSQFGVTVDVTEDGLGHVEDVVDLIMQYVRMLQREGPQEWVSDEVRATNAVSFRFRSKSPPSSCVSDLVSNMQKYAPEHSVSGSALIREYDPKAYTEMLGALTADAARVRAVGQAFAERATLKEEWYDVAYSQDRVSAATLERWATSPIDPALRLPDKNEFIATDFTIRADTSPDAALASAPHSGGGAAAAGAGALSARESPAVALAGVDSAHVDAARAATEGSPAAPGITPRLLRDDGVARLWFHQDARFREPKVYFKVQLLLPPVVVSPRMHVMTELFTRLVVERLNEFAYAAEIAGLSYDLSIITRGVQLSVAGLSHKLPVLAAKIAQRMAAVGDEFTDAEFGRLRDKAERDYKNFLLEQPYQHSLYALNYATSVPRFHVLYKLDEVTKVTADDIRAFCPVLLRAAFAQSFVYGNASPDEAKALLNSVLQPLAVEPLSIAERPLSRAVKLPTGIEHVYDQDGANPDEPNGAIEVFFEVGRDHPETSALLELLSHLMREPAFNQLRTKEQLGYIVFTGVRGQHGVEGLRIIVQSAKANPDELDERVEAFIANFRAQLLAMDGDTFKANVDAVLAQAVEQDKTPKAEFNRAWGEIAEGQLLFDRAAYLAASVGSLTHEDVVGFFDAYIRRGSEHRRKISSRVWSRAQKDARSGASTGHPKTVAAGVSSDGSSIVGAVTTPSNASKAPARLSQREGLALSVACGAASLTARGAGVDDCAAMRAARAKLGISDTLQPVVQITDLEVFKQSGQLYESPEVGTGLDSRL